jgi:hypothetical protein
MIETLQAINCLNEVSLLEAGRRAAVIPLNRGIED